MTWKPGQSGNPKGKPRGTSINNKRVRQLRTLCMDECPKAIAYLAKVVASDNEKTTDRMRAAHTLLEHGPGRIVVQAEDPMEGFENMTVEERCDLLAERMAQYQMAIQQLQAGKA